MSRTPPWTPSRPTLTTVSDTPHTRTSHSTSSGIQSAVQYQNTVVAYLHDELSGSIQRNNAAFFDHLTEHINSNKTLTNHIIRTVSLELHGWPAEKSEERDYYAPWTSMLNQFCSIFHTQSFTPLRNISFYPYDRNVQHKQSEVKLKPDVLGLPSPVLNHKDGFRVAWEDPFVVGEAKFGDFDRLIHQTASYVRAIFSHQRDRLWVYAVMLPYPNTMIFARYDRSGVIISPEYNVLLREGRVNIAKVLCALMTLKDTEFGIDRTISGNDIIVGNVVFCIVETLCYRKCVQG